MITFSFDIDHFCCIVGGSFKKGQTTPNITIVPVKNDAGLKEEWKRRVQGLFRRQNGFAELVIIRRRVEERNEVSSKVTDSTDRAPFNWHGPCLTNRSTDSNFSLKILSKIILVARMNFGDLLLCDLLMQKLADYSHINRLQGQD